MLSLLSALDFFIDFGYNLHGIRSINAFGGISPDSKTNKLSKAVGECVSTKFVISFLVLLLIVGLRKNISGYLGLEATSLIIVALGSVTYNVYNIAWSLFAAKKSHRYTLVHLMLRMLSLIIVVLAKASSLSLIQFIIIPSVITNIVFLAVTMNTFNIFSFFTLKNAYSGLCKSSYVFINSFIKSSLGIGFPLLLVSATSLSNFIAFGLSDKMCRMFMMILTPYVSFIISNTTTSSAAKNTHRPLSYSIILSVSYAVLAILAIKLNILAHIMGQDINSLSATMEILVLSVIPITINLVLYLDHLINFSEQVFTMYLLITSLTAGIVTSVFKVDFVFFLLIAEWTLASAMVLNYWAKTNSKIKTVN